MLLEWAMAYNNWFYASIVKDTWAWAIMYMVFGACFGIMVYRQFLSEKETAKG